MKWEQHTLKNGKVIRNGYASNGDVYRVQPYKDTDTFDTFCNPSGELGWAFGENYPNEGEAIKAIEDEVSLN